MILDNEFLTLPDPKDEYKDTTETTKLKLLIILRNGMVVLSMPRHMTNICRYSKNIITFSMFSKQSHFESE